MGAAFTFTLFICPYPFFVLTLTSYIVLIVSAIYLASVVGCSPYTAIKRLWPISPAGTSVSLLTSSNVNLSYEILLSTKNRIAFAFKLIYHKNRPTL